MNPINLDPEHSDVNCPACQQAVEMVFEPPAGSRLHARCPHCSTTMLLISDADEDLRVEFSDDTELDSDGKFREKLEGSLKNLSAVGALRVLHKLQLTGDMVIRSSTGEAHVWLREGEIVGTAHPQESVVAAQLLVEPGYLSREEFFEIHTHEMFPGHAKQVLIGMLVELGKLDEIEGLKLLRRLGESTVMEIAGWQEGSFVFTARPVGLAENIKSVRQGELVNLGFDTAGTLAAAMKILVDRDDSLELGAGSIGDALAHELGLDQGDDDGIGSVDVDDFDLSRVGTKERAVVKRSNRVALLLAAAAIIAAGGAWLLLRPAPPTPADRAATAADAEPAPQPAEQPSQEAAQEPAPEPAAQPDPQPAAALAPAEQSPAAAEPPTAQEQPSEAPAPAASDKPASAPAHPKTSSAGDDEAPPPDARSLFDAAIKK